MAVACADEITGMRGVCGCGPTHINRVVTNIMVDPLSYNSHCVCLLSETGQTASMSMQSAVCTVVHARTM